MVKIVKQYLNGLCTQKVHGMLSTWGIPVHGFGLDTLL